MAKRVVAYEAHDGKIFTDAAECERYEQTTMRAGAVNDMLEAFGMVDAGISSGIDGSHVVDLQDFLLDNADQIVAVLSVTPPAKPGRKPGSKAASAE